MVQTHKYEVSSKVHYLEKLVECLRDTIEDKMVELKVSAATIQGLQRRLDQAKPVKVDRFKFPIGRTVYKEKGDYYVHGNVVAHFHALRNFAPRYVVEDCNGVIFVLRETQLTDKLPA